MNGIQATDYYNAGDFEEQHDGRIRANRQMCEYCFDTLIKTLDDKGDEIAKPQITNDDFPLFVTWYKQSNQDLETYRLRGCIGTFQPGPLHSSLKRYALLSALDDRRFAPIALKELTRLKCGVSLLVGFEKADDSFDWEIGTHGIRIYFEHPNSGKQYSATYLPDVCPEQGWSQRECLESLIRKAGYNGRVTQTLLQELELERYQASKFTLTYDEYIDSNM